MNASGYLVKCGCGTFRCDAWNEWLASASSRSATVGYRKVQNYRGETECYNINVDFRCWTCGRYFQVNTIHGKRSDKHTCGAKCMASKGPSCECSCAGKNHGRSYA